MCRFTLHFLSTFLRLFCFQNKNPEADRRCTCRLPDFAYGLFSCPVCPAELAGRFSFKPAEHPVKVACIAKAAGQRYIGDAVL